MKYDMILVMTVYKAGHSESMMYVAIHQRTISRKLGVSVEIHEIHFVKNYLYIIIKP